MLNPETTIRALRMARFRIGRWLIHAGIRAMPHGRCRSELSNALWAWGMKVNATVVACRDAETDG